MSQPRGQGIEFSSRAYDSISAVYQDALISHHEHVKGVLDRLTSSGTLKPKSRILEVGCGTGKPITSYFVEHGHEVTAIDLSTGMLDLARKNAPKATILQVDMTTWDPADPGEYDLVMASHCLYTMSISQITSLVYKFTRWLKIGGLVVIGMSHNQETLKRENVTFDERGWAEGFVDTFLDHKFEGSTFGREDAWVNLIKSTGLEIVHVDSTVCLKADDPDQDAQFYIISKKVQETSLIGPFPIPEKYSGPIKLQTDVWQVIQKEREFDATKVKEFMFGTLLQNPHIRKILLATGLTMDRSEHQEQSLPPQFEMQITSELPAPQVTPGSFDAILIAGLLHGVASPEKFLDHAIDALKPGSPAQVIVAEGAPDSELTDLLNKAIEGLGLPHAHFGYILREAEKKCRTAGFENIRFVHINSILNFGPIEGEEEIKAVAELLSGLWTDDASLRTQIADRLKKLLKVHFIFKPNGEIGSQIALLIAERN